jgi:hypothetical protein
MANEVLGWSINQIRIINILTTHKSDVIWCNDNMHPGGLWYHCQVPLVYTYALKRA